MIFYENGRSYGYIALPKGLTYNSPMMNPHHQIHKIIFKGILLSALVIFTVVLIILKSNVQICEQWTRSFARWYESAFGTVFMWIPFSLTEIIVVALAIIVIILLVQTIKSFIRRMPLRGTSKILSIFLIAGSIIALYQATAEMAYNREHHPVTVYEEKVEKTEFRKINEYFIDDMNKVAKEMKFEEDGNLLCPYSHDEMNDLLAKEFDRLQLEFGDYFTPFTTRTKQMATSFLYRELHITGVTFMPTTEANINYLNVNSLKPITYAHEILHTKGVMKEEDADFIALYLMLTSDNSYFRYSGYYFSLSSLIYLTNYTDVETDYQEVIALLDTNFRKNLSFGYEYWRKHNAFAEFGNWINDLYLRLSGEKDGTKSYDDTPTEVDPEKEEVISFSLYQKLYFKLYYERNLS